MYSFKNLNKARVLKKLKIKSAKIPYLISFTEKEFKNKNTKLLNKINKTFKKSIAIRSSNSSEDQEKKSFEGYFESEKYFKDYRDNLLNEFSLKSNPNLDNNIYKNMIDSSNVVSIAFRTRRFTETDRDHFNKDTQLKTSNFESSTAQYIYRAIEFFKSKMCRS